VDFISVGEADVLEEDRLTLVLVARAKFLGRTPVGQEMLVGFVGRIGEVMTARISANAAIAQITRRT
jgi:hypothetical protein